MAEHYFKAEDLGTEEPAWVRGEYALIRSILSTALEDIAAGRVAESDEMDAYEWVVSDNEDEWSCYWICKILGLPIGYVKGKAKELRGKNDKARK